MQPPPPVAGIQWRPGRADDVDALTEVGVAADRVDVPGHPRARSEAAQLLAVVDPRRAVLVGERDGRPVAFGSRFRPGGGPVRLSGAVVPELRGRGVGRALLQALLDDAAVAEPDAERASVRSVGDAGVAPLARRFGFEQVRDFLTMRRDLSRLVEPAALPADLHVVPFGPALDEPLRLLKNDVFRDHWQGLADEPAEWRARMLGPQLQRSASRIAVDASGAVAGFVLVWRIDDHPEQAHIPLVGTARAHRGRGVARALLASVLAASAEAGLTEAELDVDAASPTGAPRVYAAVGFEEVSRATVWSRPLR
jgi:mycothiol synthase